MRDEDEWPQGGREYQVLDDPELVVSDGIAGQFTYCRSGRGQWVPRGDRAPTAGEVMVMPGFGRTTDCSFMFVAHTIATSAAGSRFSRRWEHSRTW
jgi:hypothetical protein